MTAAGTAVLGAVVYVVFDARAVVPGLRAYWRGYYVPVHDGFGPSARFVLGRFEYVHSRLGLGPAWLAAALLVIGLVTIARRGRPAAALAAALLWPEMVLVSAAGKYPFLDVRHLHLPDDADHGRGGHRGRGVLCGGHVVASRRPGRDRRRCAARRGRAGRVRRAGRAVRPRSADPGREHPAAGPVPGGAPGPRRIRSWWRRQPAGASPTTGRGARPRAPPTRRTCRGMSRCSRRSGRSSWPGTRPQSRSGPRWRPRWLRSGRAAAARSGWCVTAAQSRRRGQLAGGAGEPAPDARGRAGTASPSRPRGHARRRPGASPWRYECRVRRRGRSCTSRRRRLRRRRASSATARWPARTRWCP